MKINVLMFGPLADVAGRQTIEVTGVNNTDLLREMLFRKYPGLKRKTFLMALRSRLCNGNEWLQDGDVVALLPPFSGG